MSFVDSERKKKFFIKKKKESSSVTKNLKIQQRIFKLNTNVWVQVESKI